MTGKLRIDWKRAVKYSWIATSISLIQLGLGSSVLYPNYSFTNIDALLYLMLLSFPSSFLTVALTASFIDVYPPMEYIIICLVAFISGYVQWFWFLPRIVQKREIVSLHLTDHERETRPIAATNPTLRRKSDRLKLIPRAPFDKSGHSPLERAIGIKRG